MVKKWHVEKHYVCNISGETCAVSVYRFNRNQPELDCSLCKVYVESKKKGKREDFWIGSLRVADEEY